mmetsp:Transcript_30617/g.46694  ORF Transcript_30617/g.46694 Transcript_30617/m.46694 type:complete len:394 (-) Transcript_30617:357-1538(-)
MQSVVLVTTKMPAIHAEDKKKEEPRPPLRKLSLWSKCNIFMLNACCAIAYHISKPFGFEKAIGTMFISSMFGLMMFLPPLFLWLVVKIADALILPGFYDTIKENKVYFGIAIFLWYAHTILTEKAPFKPGRVEQPKSYIDRAAHQFYYESVVDYFSLELIPWAPDAELPTSRQYVFGIHPHGVFCWSLWMFAEKGSPFDQRFPGLCGERLNGLIASVLFYIPVVRDFFLQFPYIDASRKCASKALAQGQSLYIIPGGEEENVLTHYGKDIVVLKKRKGFIRLALSYGADLVPVFGAGTTDTFVTYPELFGIRKWLQKRFRISMELYRGRWFTPLPFTNTPQRVLIGKPIPTPTPKVKGAKPDDALVDEYHAKYIAALKELHDKHVKDRPLIIL